MSKKLCVFYGNCQVIYNVHGILSNYSPFTNSYNSISYVNHDNTNISHLKNIDINHFKQCDVLIYQPLDDNHGVYSASAIKKILKAECIQISFPYIYNCALYTVYFEPATIRWTFQTLINCGWSNIIELILKRTSLKDILELYDNNKIDFYFDKRMELSINTLKRKEEQCNINVSNFILENYKDKRLFITQNHISNYFIQYVSKNILKLLNIDYSLPEYINDQKDYIEAECVFDKYNMNYHKFNYDFIINDNLTKNKIINFYHYFISNKDNIIKDFASKDSLFIHNDPEKFINGI